MGTLVLAAALLLGAPGGEWRTLRPGLERRSVSHDEAVCEVFRIDPGRLEVRVVLASRLGQPALTARGFAEATGALLAVNGGFFDPHWNPVGLRVSQGVSVGRPSARLGVLALSGGRLRIGLGRDLRRLGSPRELIQSGPRLVVAGAPNRLKPQVSRRTAAGIDGEGRLVVLVTRSGALEAGSLAELLAAPAGLALREALNLDGGGSSQLYLRAGDEILDIAGTTPVADALVVLPPPGRR